MFVSQSHDFDQSNPKGSNTMSVWQSIFLCGAVCTAGTIDIRKYARCRSKRAFGQIGLGATFSTFAYCAFVDDDTEWKLMARARADPHLKQIILTAVAADRYAVTNEPLYSEPTVSHLAQFYQDRRYTDEDKQLIADESFKFVWLKPKSRAVAHLLMRSRLEDAGVSPPDIYKCTLLIAWYIESVDMEIGEQNVLVLGALATLAGVVSPCWPTLICPLFLTS